MSDLKDKPRSVKPDKFLFDINCFDEDHVEEVVEEAPPPPTFSEEELAAARADSYARGKEDGLAEAEASRERQVAALVEKISHEFKTLFYAEDKRSTQYETEVLMVARAIFAILFPALNARQGLAEIEDVIADVLESHAESPEIIVEVGPAFVEDIRVRLAPAAAGLAASGKVDIRANENLGPGDCRMRWQDGGAARDISALSAEIGRRLEHMLADRPSLQDNGQMASDEPTEDSGDNGDHSNSMENGETL